MCKRKNRTGGKCANYKRLVQNPSFWNLALSRRNCFPLVKMTSSKPLTGFNAPSEVAKKETLRIVPQQLKLTTFDTVELTYPG